MRMNIGDTQQLCFATSLVYRGDIVRVENFASSGDQISHIEVSKVKRENGFDCGGMSDCLHRSGGGRGVRLDHDGGIRRSCE